MSVILLTINYTVCKDNRSNKRRGPKCDVQPLALNCRCASTPHQVTVDVRLGETRLGGSGT